jgi:hypothetical protein
VTHTYEVSLTFDGWTVAVDIDATVTVDRDDDPDSGTLLTVEHVDVHDTDSALWVVVCELWADEFPDTPCPFTIADIAAKSREIEESIADAVFQMPFDD